MFLSGFVHMNKVHRQNNRRFSSVQEIIAKLQLL